MSVRIVKAVTYDIRFPTSRSGAGSDAMNPDPDYSAAYVTLETDDPSGIAGHGLTFTIGRGTEVCVAAIEALAPHVVGADGRRARRRPRRFLAATRDRLPAALARAREGRDPPRHRSDRERRLGPLREARGQAALEAPRRHDPGADRRVHRLPLHRRRAHSRRGARDPQGERALEDRAGGAAARRGLPGVHDVRGLDRLPGGQRFRSGPARRSPPGSPT